MVAKKTAAKERSAPSSSKAKATTTKDTGRPKSKDIDAVKKQQRTIKVVTKKPVLPNVIYIGHLPKHCEERELIGFLKQFGILTQLRVCRSHKTGGSKGYAFAKFQDPDVAAIVADTLNGHLLFQKKLVSHVLPPEQIHQKLFASKTRTVFQRKPVQREQPKSMEKMEEISKRLIEREQQKRDKLKQMGIDYDFPGYEAAKQNKEDEEKSDANDNEKETGKPTPKKSKKERSSSKKRKHSFDEQSPEATKQKESDSEKDRPQSDTKAKKKKKKKKKDKKRRKSAP